MDEDTSVSRELSSLILNLSFSFISLQVSPASSRWRKHFAVAAEIGS